MFYWRESRRLSLVHSIVHGDRSRDSVGFLARSDTTHTGVAKAGTDKAKACAATEQCVAR